MFQSCQGSHLAPGRCFKARLHLGNTEESVFLFGWHAVILSKLLLHVSHEIPRYPRVGTAGFQL